MKKAGLLIPGYSLVRRIEVGKILNLPTLRSKRSHGMEGQRSGKSFDLRRWGVMMKEGDVREERKIERLIGLDVMTRSERGLETLPMQPLRYANEQSRQES